MTTEERATGHVRLDVLHLWARAAGGAWVPFAVVFAYGLVECINVVPNGGFDTYWSNMVETRCTILVSMHNQSRQCWPLSAVWRYDMLCGLQGLKKVKTTKLVFPVQH
jgi:hypothetical protein